MGVTLFDLDGSRFATGRIPSYRAFPEILRLSPVDGSHRFYKRRGPNVGEGDSVYDEFEPVEVVLESESER